MLGLLGSAVLGLALPLAHDHANAKVMPGVALIHNATRRTAAREHVIRRLFAKAARLQQRASGR